MASVSERDVVIIGGGIIGCTSAYFLTRHHSYDPAKHRITLLEASKVAGGASGKAGGLLGLWAYPKPLAHLSFSLHEELATEHGGLERWGYRKIYCGSLDARGRQLEGAKVQDAGYAEEIGALRIGGKNGLKATSIPQDLNWIDGKTSPQYSGIGTPADTAQVHPYHFTIAMAQLATERGAKILNGMVTDIGKHGDAVRYVTYLDKETSLQKTIQATDVIIAAGPWSRSLFPAVPITALRAHSVTITPSKAISGYALFTEIVLPRDFRQTNKSIKSKPTHNKKVTPEIYARPNNEAYACGEGDHLVPLPKSTADVETDDARCQDIIDYTSSISDELKYGKVTTRQACYLPQGGPFIGETGIKGLLFASGHSCWGIQNGPGTGKLISEFVFDGEAKSANIANLDPRTAFKNEHFKR